jgi:hypothetical protein
VTDFKRDPLINAIENGIKEDIRIAHAKKRFRAVIILIYSGMDTMAYLDLPAGRDEVTRDDFIRWAERYIRFPCKEQLTGADLYGARCAMLHVYGVSSRLSRAGKCRQIGYMDHSVPEIRYNPSISKDLVLVSVAALKDAFFKGIDAFLVNAFANKAKAPVVEARFQTLMCDFTVKEQPSA